MARWFTSFVRERTTVRTKPPCAAASSGAAAAAAALDRDVDDDAITSYSASNFACCSAYSASRAETAAYSAGGGDGSSGRIGSRPTATPRRGRWLCIDVLRVLFEKKYSISTKKLVSDGAHFSYLGNPVYCSLPVMSDRAKPPPTPPPSAEELPANNLGEQLLAMAISSSPTAAATTRRTLMKDSHAQSSVRVVHPLDAEDRRRPLRRRLEASAHSSCHPNGRPTEGVLMASYSDDGHKIVTAGGDAKVIVWERESLDLPWSRTAVIVHHVFNPADFAHSCSSAVFAPQCSGVCKPNGEIFYILSAGDNGYAQIFEVDSAITSVEEEEGERERGGAADAAAASQQRVGVTLVAKFNHPKGTRGLPRIRSAKFSPSGKYIATAGFDGSARLWSIKSFDNAGRAAQILKSKAGDDRFDVTCLRVLQHDNMVWSANFASNDDTVLTSSFGGTANIWGNLRLSDLPSGTLLDRAKLPLQSGAVPDGTVRDDSIAKHVLRGHHGPVTCAVFHPSFDPNVIGHAGRAHMHAGFHDVNLVATSGYDKEVGLWSTTTHRRIHTFSGHNAAVWSVAFSHSPEKPHLVSSDAEGCVRVWDVHAKVCVSVLRGHTTRVWSVCFSPLREPIAETMGGDQNQIITASEGGGIRCWDAGATEGIAMLSPVDAMLTDGGRLEEPDVTVCAYAPRSTGEFATASSARDGSGGIVRIWNAYAMTRHAAAAQRNNPVDATCSGSAAQRTAQRGGGRSWMSSRSSGINPKRWAKLPGKLELDVENLRMSASSLDGDWVELDRAAHDSNITSLDFSHDGARLLTASEDCTVIVWQRVHHKAETIFWKILAKIAIGADPANGTVAGVRFQPKRDDAFVVATGIKQGERGGVSIWEAAADDDEGTWQQTRGFTDDSLDDAAHSGDTNSVGWSPAGTDYKTRLISASKDGSVKLWDVATGALLCSRMSGGKKSVGSAAFSPDGAHFAFVDDGGMVTLYEAVAPFNKVWGVKRHVSRVSSLAWSHNSTLIATAGMEDKVSVVDATSGAVMVSMCGQNNCKRINSVVFSESDGMIASASNNGRVVFWPIRPPSTRETLDLLRAHPGAQPTAQFIENLDFLNTWSSMNWEDRYGSTALHILAEISVAHEFWGDATGQIENYERLLAEWSSSKVRYAPVVNDAGQTPLEVAILTRNHRFFDALKMKKNIIKLAEPGTADGGVDDLFSDGTAQNTITVNDLDVMLDWSTSRQAVIDYLQLPTLLVPVDETLLGWYVCTRLLLFILMTAFLVIFK